MSQTTVQNPDAIQFGSGKLEYSIDDGVSWVDLGAMRDIVFLETFEEVEVPSDNAGIVKQGIKNQIATLAGNLMELDLEKIAALRGGLDSFTEDPGISKKLTSGGKHSQTPIQVQVTNTDENDNIYRITLYKVTSIKGIELVFNPDDEFEPNLIPIEVKGVNDVSRTVGDQLFEIYSEQDEAIS